eukprot:349894-Chlamydomonas_euryale.AAC.10
MPGTHHLAQPGRECSHDRLPDASCLASTFMRSEDEYDVNFVYGPEASNADVTKRHLEPLVKKVIEGYNATVLCFGATGAIA